MPEKIDVLEKSYQLFSSLNALQQKFLSKIEQLVPVITGDVWKRAQENGEVLLNYIAPEIDADLYASLATEICHLLARERGERRRSWNEYLTSLTENPVICARICCRRGSCRPDCQQLFLRQNRSWLTLWPASRCDLF